MIPFLNLVVYVCLSFVAGFYTSSLHVSTWLLHGLHSYLYPDASPGQEMQDGSGFKNTKMKEVQTSKDGKNVGKAAQDHSQVPSGVEAKSNVNKAGEKPYPVLRRTEQKRKEKYKDKFRWEEGSSQIYRLTLSHKQLMGRLYFAEYDEAVVYTVVGLMNLFAHEGLSYVSHFLHMETDEHARKFDLIPFLMGGFAVYKIVRLLAQVGWQSSTSRVSELMLSIVVGFVGFVIALCLLFFASSLLLDCGLETLFSVTSSQPTSGRGSSRQQFGIFMMSPTLSRVMIAVIAGLIAGILVTPAHRVARSFWLGTDQLQWNIPMAKWGVVAHFLLHVNVALPLFSSIIWIKPMASLFVISEASKQSGFKGQGMDAEGNVGGVQFWGNFLLLAPSDDWAQDFGVPRNVFVIVQFWGLLVAGLLHLSLFRVHVQTYLNEALIVWYEGLHRSKVMNLELVQAKLLLNSYFLCRVAMQFFVPGILVALLLGMSRVWGGVPLLDLAETSPNLFFLRVVALFMAWWATFSWSLLTCVTLALYRVGFLLAS